MVNEKHGHPPTQIKVIVVLAAMSVSDDDMPYNRDKRNKNLWNK